jgi:FMNH2-dependent dimethyl sulfone monooxygenase
MRYGYWMPVFGGWLRNVSDEGMEASWDYVSRLAKRSEEIGYSLSLIAELQLNDIKGRDAPSLEAWSTAAALAAVTRELELMVAVRPTFHAPGLFAKQAANIDAISGGRLSLNVVSSWWEEEARSLGFDFDKHDDRYKRTGEWLDVVDRLWTQTGADYAGDLYRLRNATVEPKPMRKPRPLIYAGGESEAAKSLIAEKCDAYVMHGDTPEVIGEKIADMEARRQALGKSRMTYGMAAYAIVRDTEAEAQAELGRITAVDPNLAKLPPGFANFDQWLSGTQLERQLKLEEYSVSNRGLRPRLVGTPEMVRERVAAFEAVGLDLLLLQMSPQFEEMERFAAQVIAA